ncbi:Uncharacterised protein [Mycobacterium tuberculosis]|nr:Uncharacterised protein [Mycobacterium tuberculosis]
MYYTKELEEQLAYVSEGTIQRARLTKCRYIETSSMDLLCQAMVFIEEIAYRLKDNSERDQGGYDEKEA